MNKPMVFESSYLCILFLTYFTDKGATSWENRFKTYENTKGADQPAHPRSLINIFVVRCQDSVIPLVFISELSNLLLVTVAVQAGLCLTRSETPKTGFLMTRLNYSFDFPSVSWLGKRFVRFLRCLNGLQHFSHG